MMLSNPYTGVWTGRKPKEIGCTAWVSRDTVSGRVSIHFERADESKQRLDMDRHEASRLSAELVHYAKQGASDKQPANQPEAVNAAAQRQEEPGDEKLRRAFVTQAVKGVVVALARLEKGLQGGQGDVAREWMNDLYMALRDECGAMLTAGIEAKKGG